MSEVIRPDGRTVPVPLVVIDVDVNMKTVLDGKMVTPQEAIARLMIERDYWKDRAGTFEAQLGDLKAKEQGDQG